MRSTACGARRSAIKNTFFSNTWPLSRYLSWLIMFICACRMRNVFELLINSMEWHWVWPTDVVIFITELHFLSWLEGKTKNHHNGHNDDANEVDVQSIIIVKLEIILRHYIFVKNMYTLTIDIFCSIIYNISYIFLSWCDYIWHLGFISIEAKVRGTDFEIFFVFKLVYF
jgi:hypothetical protein